MSPARVKCPTCRREIDWASSDFRPFCSERCRLLDLGNWAAERYVISEPVIDESSPEDPNPNETEH